MTTNRTSTDASKHRAVGRPVLRFQAGLAFVSLALLGLTQPGCKSDGCSSCGSGLGSRFNNGVQSVTTNVQAFGARVFHHKKGGCDTCGTLGTYEEGTVIDAGTPVVVPGVVPVPPPGSIVPAPAPSSIEPAPSQLDPISDAKTGAAPTSGRMTPGANRSAYETSNNPPRGGIITSKRGSDLSRAYESSTPTQAAYAPEQPDVLDNLPPPVDLPGDVTGKGTPIADPTSPPNASKPSSAGPPAAATTVEPGSTPSPAEKVSAGDGRGAGQPKSAAVAVRATPGMARSAPVAPAVAGGSLPSSEGLAWLKEKGYRTLVDLRPRAEVDTAFPEQVTDNGMLYVAIPFALDPISLSRLARFNDLMNQTDQRPLYFCDGDGRRAGLLWYLRLRSVDREEPNLARPKAEEVGLNAADIDQAERFLKLNFAMDATPILPGMLAVQSFGAATDAAPAPIAAASTAPSLLPVASPIAANEAASAAFTRRAGGDPEPFALAPSWKPVTALVLSGLGVPLAYWSGSTLFQKRAPRRASLTAKGPGPRKSLPRSDV